MAVAAAMLWAWQAWQKRKETYWEVGIIPLLVYGLWQSYLTFWWKSSLASATNDNLGLPLAGLIRGFQEATSAVGGSQSRWGLEVGALALLALCTLFCLRDSEASRHEKVSWGLSLALLLLLTAKVWIEDWAFLRAASLFYCLAMVILLHTRSAISTTLLAVGICTWGIVAINLLFYR